MAANEIGTWIGVVATAITAVVTIGTAFIRSRTKERLAAIEAKTPDAARIVADAVTSFALDTSGLSQAQVFQLAKIEIETRDKRHARLLRTSLGLAVVLAGATVVLNVLSSGVHIVSVEGSGNTVVQGSPSAHAGTP